MLVEKGWIHMRMECEAKDEMQRFRYRAAAIIVEDNCVLFAGNDRDDYYYSVGGGVYVGETAEEAVVREVWEETGIHYEIDRLAVVHENLFTGKGGPVKGKHCHELSFYFLMKSKGNKIVDEDGHVTNGVLEKMHWIPIKDIDKYKTYPYFLKDFLKNKDQGILHIVTDEREE